MRMRSLALALMAMSVPAQAESVASLFGDGTTSGCYKRVYDKAHLAKNPKQTVTAIELVFGKPQAPGTQGDYAPIGFSLQVKVRGAKAGSGSGEAYCKNEGGGIQCALEGDAGAFSLTSSGAKGIVLTATREISFETESGVIDIGKGEDAVFSLTKASTKGCHKRD